MTGDIIGDTAGSVYDVTSIVAFMDATDFEDAIRNAISIGGDSDTIGCITGSIAEAYYGVPDSLRATAMTYLPDSLKAIVDEFENKCGSKQATGRAPHQRRSRRSTLSQYLTTAGRWVIKIMVR